MEPTASTTEEDVPTTTDSPTVTIGPVPTTTEEEGPSTTEEPATTTGEETQIEVTVTHTTAPTPMPPTPENPNPQQKFSANPGQQEMPEPIKAAARQPAVVFLVLINIIELIIMFWLEDTSLCLASTWIAIGLWAAGPSNSAVKEVSVGIPLLFVKIMQMLMQIVDRRHGLYGALSFCFRNLEVHFAPRQEGSHSWTRKPADCPNHAGTRVSARDFRSIILLRSISIYCSLLGCK